MKKYRTLQNNYIKKNTFANNTLGYYRKPIFIACISFLIIAICSLLIYQVTHIEKSERKKTVLCTKHYYGDLKESILLTTSDEKLAEEFNIYVFNNSVDINNIELLETLDSLGFVRKLVYQNKSVIYEEMTILYTESGQRYYTYYSSSYIKALEKAGWIK